MNVTRFKCPASIPYQLNSSLIFLRPLSQYEISSAEQAAKIYYRADSKYANLERMIQIVASASNSDPNWVRQATPNAVAACYRAWLDVHNESVPDCASLSEYLSYAIWIDDEVVYDGLAASHSSSASDFYGTPVALLTAGQLVYYVLARNAYQKKTESDKKVTKTWLEKMRQKWERSESGKQ